jgi:hypothetical protein
MDEELKIAIDVAEHSQWAHKGCISYEMGCN